MDPIEQEIGKPFVQPRRLDAVRFLRIVLTFFRPDVLRAARSGSFLPPVSRFHSSNVSFEIFPSTRSCANLRLCAWLLNGIGVGYSISDNGDSAGPDRTAPFGLNLEPWHGQSQVRSASFQATTQPMCVHVADRSVVAPLSSR